MFETIVADLLAKYLGDYIRGLNTENLKIGIWSGNVSLENLELKESALENLNLPFTVKKGYLGKLTLKIPWHNLKGEPVIVLCDNLFAVATPSSQWDEKASDERAFKQKMEKLTATESIRFKDGSKAQQPHADVQTSSTFASQFLTKIIDNLQISIFNIHVMVESDEAYPNNPYTAGVTLEHLHIKSATEKWEPAFIHQPHKSVFKIVSLKNLAVYWNPRTDPLKYTSTLEMISKLSQNIYKEGGKEPNHQYILHPVCCTLKVELTKSNVGLPNYKCNCEFDDVTIELRPAQYRDVMDLLDWITRVEKGRKYRKFLPIGGRPTQNPSAWWRFAIQSVVSDIHERRHKWSAAYFSNRKIKKLEYIQLYKAKKRNRILPLEQQKLNQLEHDLPYEDLVFFRSLAEVQLRGEVTQNLTTNMASSQSWRDWIWYYWSPEKSVDSEPSLPVELSPEQRKELFSAIDYNEQQPSYIEVPKDHVFVQINFLMKTGSMLLQLQDGPQREDADLAAVFTGLSLSLSIMSQSFKVNASLSATDIYDCYSIDTLYPCLIGPLTDVPLSNTIPSSPGSHPTPPVFDMVFEINPLHSEADYSLMIKLMPLEMVYNRAILEEILHFFGNAPRSTLDNIERSARYQYEALKNKTTLKIQYELQHYKTIHLDVNIQAPHILIPEDIYVESPALLLDLGLLSITSVVKDKTHAIETINASTHTEDTKQNENDNNNNNNNNNNIEEQPPEKEPQDGHRRRANSIQSTSEDFYDEYQIKMSNIQLILINKSNKANEQLVDPFSINFSIFNCMIKSQTILSQLKIFGDLPSLRFYMSPVKIQKVMNILRLSVIPNSRPASPTLQRQQETFSNPHESVSEVEIKELEGLVAAVTLTECSFTVPEVIVSISDGETEIVRLGIIGLKGRLVDRTYDTKVFLSLNQMWVEDYYQKWGEPFSFLARSSSNPDDKQDLIKTCFTIHNKNSPYYSGVDQFLDFYFNTLDLACNRETVIQLRDMWNELKVTTNQPIVEMPSPRLPTADLNIKVRLFFRKVSLTLNGGGKHFAKAEMTNLHLLTTIKPDSLTACGKLGNISLVHLSPNSLKDVGPLLGTDGEHMVDFVVEFGIPMDTGLIPMSTIRIVLSTQFWCELHEYFSVMPSVGKMPVDTSKAVEMISDSYMVKFEVLIASPHIVVPRHTPGAGSFTFQLGQISIYNSFEAKAIEVIHVRIMSMQAQTQNLRGVSQNLMEPVNVGIDVNLGLPVQVAINISKVKVTLTEKQYGLAIAIIRDNIIAASNYTNSETCQVTSSNEEGDSFIPTLERRSSVQPSNGRVLQLHLGLEQVEFEIFRGREFNASVMAFKSGKFNLDSSVHADDSIKATFAVTSVTLRDTSPSNNLFKQLLGPTADADPDLMQVHGKLERTPTKNWDLFLAVDNIRGVIVGDAVKAIIDFVYPGLDSLYTLSASTAPSRPSSPPRPQSPATSPIITGNGFCFSATVELNHTELCAMESPHVENTQAFVAKSDNFTIRTVLFPESETYELKWHIENLEVVKCFLDRETTSAVCIVAPTSGSGSFYYTSTPLSPLSPIGSRTGIESPIGSQMIPPELIIAMEPFQITFSYHDLGLAKGIFEQLSTVADVLSNSSSTASSPSTDYSSFPVVNIKSPAAELLLIDDYSCSGRSLPLINIKFNDIFVDVLKSRTFFGFKMKADYYNIELCVWEPFIEPWQCKVGLHSSVEETAATPPPTHPRGRIESISSLSSSPPTAPPQLSQKPTVSKSASGAYEVIIMSRTPLNVNFSKPLVDTFGTFLNLLQGPSNPQHSLRPSLLVPLILRNDCGQSITWECYSVKGKASKRHSGRLEDGHDHPLWLNAEGKRRGAISFSDYRINFGIVPWGPVSGLPIDKAGVYVIPLTHPHVLQNPNLVYEVTSRDASKLLIVRSNVLVRNATKHSIDTLVEQNPRNNPCILKAIAPNNQRAVPISLVTAATLQFSASSLAAPQWSTQRLKCNNLEPHTEPIRCKPHFYCLQVNKYHADSLDSKHHDFLVQISPPFVVENLLPIPLQIALTDHTFKLDMQLGELLSGNALDIYEVDPTHHLFLRIKIEGFDWSSFVQINQSSEDDINRQLFTLLDDKKRSLNLNMEYIQSFGCIKVVIYCKYWIVNRTGLPAMYKPNTRMFAIENLAAGQKDIGMRHLQLEGDSRDWYPSAEERKLAQIEKPLLYSFSDDDVQARNRMISIKIANSEWSKGLWIESPGTVTHTTLHCIDENNDNVTQLQLSMSVDLAEGKFFRTRVVTFSPRFILINHLTHRIYYKQKTALTPAHLDPNEKIPFHWQDSSASRELAICIEPFGKFSGGFRVDGGNGDWMVKMPLLGRKGMVLTLVQVVVEQGVTFVIFKPRFPPYRIENYTPGPIEFYQKDIGTKQILGSGQTQPYAWDELTATRRLVVSIPNSGFTHDYSLDRLKALPLTSVAPLGVAPFNFTIEVFADGPAKVFRIADPANTSIPAPLAAEESGDGSKVNFVVRTIISSVGLSIIDSTPQELAYLSFEDIELVFFGSSQEQELNFVIRKFQMDNQLLNTPFPVMISHQTQVEAPEGSSTTHATDFFCVRVVRQVPTTPHTDSPIMYMIRELQVHLAELEVNLEEDFLTKVSSFIMLLFPPVPHVLDPNADAIPTPKSEGGDSDLMIYFERLYLAPLDGTLSYTNSTTHNVNAVYIRGLVRTLLGSLGAAVANIDSAPIHLADWQLDHQFVTKESMSSRLSAHYKDQALKALYKVLLWGDLLGSPLGLLNNVGNGVYDFVAESAQGLETGAFVDGIAKGTSSLIKNSVYGVFNTTNKITKSVGKVLAPLSLDSSYVQSRVEAGREDPTEHIYNGLTMGVRDLTHGFMGGLKGIFVDPIRGAQEEGVAGLVKGARKGIMSALVKPTVGAIDLISRTAQGVRNSAGPDASHRIRVRAPRFFASDKVLLAYDGEKSHWQNNILNWLEQGKHRNEHYVTHFQVGTKIILISTYFVFRLTLKTIEGYQNLPSVKWKVPIRDISSVVEGEGYLKFYVLHHTQDDSFKQDYKVRFVLPDELKRKYYKSIKDTVTREQTKPLYCSNHKI